LQNASADTSALLHPVKDTDQQRRFNVYRNNRMVSLIDNLRSTYPALRQLVGDEFFTAGATAFINVTPPTQPVMAEYGEGFGRFIMSLPNTRNMPFLNDIAQLEWQRLQAYHCRNAQVLNSSALAEVAPDTFLSMRFQCHPALHCLVSEWPIGAIWSICSEGSASEPNAHRDINMRDGESVVITRPHLDVLVNRIDHAAAIFLNALCSGETLGDSAELGLACDNEFNVGEHLTGLIALGAFSQIM